MSTLYNLFNKMFPVFGAIKTIKDQERNIEEIRARLDSEAGWGMRLIKKEKKRSDLKDSHVK